MFKNQLQELAQQYGHNLPSYSCVREGPDHAPKFKSTVNYNGETFESPEFHNTLRQAEHSAAEAALLVLHKRGRSGVLDESGSCKNLLQETAQRVGIPLPVYNTVRVGPGHCPLFVCTVEFAWRKFSGEPAKTKKQAEKNSAMVAWTSLKRFASKLQPTGDERGARESEQTIVVKALLAAKAREERMNRYSAAALPRRRNYMGYGSPTQTRSLAQPAYEPRHIGAPWLAMDAPSGNLHGGNELFPPAAASDAHTTLYYYQPPEAGYHSNISIKPGSSYQRMAPMHHYESGTGALPLPAASGSPSAVAGAAATPAMEGEEVVWLRGGPSGTHPSQRMDEYHRGMTWPLSESDIHSNCAVGAEAGFGGMPPVSVRTLMPVYASPRQPEEEYDHLEASTRILLNQLSL